MEPAQWRQEFYPHGSHHAGPGVRTPKSWKHTFLWLDESLEAGEFPSLCHDIANTLDSFEAHYPYPFRKADANTEAWLK